MTKTADEIIASLPDFMKDNFAQRFSGTREAASTPITNTNKGALSNVVFEKDVVADVVAPTPYQGKISPGIYAERGDELAVWRNGKDVNVQLRCRSGDTYYGSLAPALLAEGGFEFATATSEDKAFISQVIGDVIHEAKLASVSVGEDSSPRISPDDFNYSNFATALWTNQDRSGPAVHRAFLVFEWASAGGSWYPKNAILFDGERTKVIVLSRNSGTSVRAPQWTGNVR